MKAYRNSLKRAAGSAGTSLRFVGSDLGEWCYPAPYRAADWPAAERIVDELESQGWVVEQRTADATVLAIDDHVLHVGERDGAVVLTLDTRKAIASAPAH